MLKNIGRAACQRRWCSQHPIAGVPEADPGSDIALSREEALRKKWKHVDIWPYPDTEMGTLDVSGDKIHRPFGIFDDPTQAFRQPLQDAPNAFVKSPRLEIYENPMPVPTQDTDIYTQETTESNAIVLKVITDRDMWEQALGEQLFRTDDLNKNSTEYYPLGYGLPVHTASLIIEDDDTGERYYHICGGRSDHKTFVEGHCVTMRVDPTLFFHVLYYFGEMLVQQSQPVYHHKYRGLCIWGHGIDEEDADFLNGFFIASRLAMEVDLERLDEGCEGFVAVKYKELPACSQVVPPPGFEFWKEGSEGIFCWQTLFHSVPKHTDTRDANTREHWQDPYLLRPLKNINHRAFNGAANNDGSDPDFHLKWGNDGLRGSRLRERISDTPEHDPSEPIDITRHQFLNKSSKGPKITNSFLHGFVHPVFTTQPDSDE
eukprot:TRINITY_DN19537_c0_g1_i1.p1 TRINITY_DN19537_c0_g1~~TRINITY_DN19537_c0_g1_i1.p1  ORF type:complete len:430 (+),score=39.50 TRINITY_DN19537_c0_g1_i1:89-1378(+)